VCHSQKHILQNKLDPLHFTLVISRNVLKKFSQINYSIGWVSLSEWKRMVGPSEWQAHIHYGIPKSHYYENCNSIPVVSTVYYRISTVRLRRTWVRYCEGPIFGRSDILKVSHCSQGHWKTNSNTNHNLILLTLHLILTDPRAKYKLIHSEKIVNLWNRRPSE